MIESRSRAYELRSTSCKWVELAPMTRISLPRRYFAFIAPFYRYPACLKAAAGVLKKLGKIEEKAGKVTLELVI
jgi:hypothetical protein